MVKVAIERRVGKIRRGMETKTPEAGEIDEGTILKAVLENPGAAQGELKAIKRELENLQHLTQSRVLQFEQVQFENLLLQAIRRSGSTQFYAIDAMLGQIMLEQGITKERFIAKGRENEIRSAAVETVLAGAEVIALKYQNGKPFALNVTPAILEQLPDHVSIPDGREVLFRVPKLTKQGGTMIRGHQDVPAYMAKRTVSKAREVLV